MQYGHYIRDKRTPQKPSSFINTWQKNNTSFRRRKGEQPIQKRQTCKNHQQMIFLLHQHPLSCLVEGQTDHDTQVQLQLSRTDQGTGKWIPSEAFSQCLGPKVECRDDDLHRIINHITEAY